MPSSGSAAIDALRREILADPDNAWAVAVGQRPLFAASPASRVAIIGQAPGSKAQKLGKPWADPSGDRLRTIYAQRFYLKLPGSATLTATVHDYASYLPERIPLVHPSPLNFRWQAKNPWFETDLLPVLRSSVRAALDR